jgi:SAM-dependent methyltransferase
MPPDAKSPPARSDQIARVFSYLRGLHATHYMDLGVRMGLFRALAERPRRPEQLAADLGLHPPYVVSFCDMGHHLELLDREDGVFRLAPDMDRLLAAPDDTFYLGGFPRVHLTVARDYAAYEELFRTGGTIPYGAHDRGFLEDVAGATRALPRMFLEVAGPRLGRVLDRLADGGRILDVGCGAGHALVALAERFPRATAVGIEIEPHSRELAASLIRSRGLADRIQVHPDWDLPGGYQGAFDLVTQFLVLHEIRPELKQDVLDRCAAALRPGGALLLFDEAQPEDDETARHPIRGFGVVAQWFELVWGNVIDTRTAILAMLSRAGLVPEDEIELSRFRIFTARRA